MVRRFALASAALIAAALPAHARDCNQFEVTMFQLIDQTMAFREEPGFEEYGWNRSGPSGGWLNRYRSALIQADDTTKAEFIVHHGFDPAMVQYVTEAFRDGVVPQNLMAIDDLMMRGERCEMP